MQLPELLKLYDLLYHMHQELEKLSDELIDDLLLQMRPKARGAH